MIRNIIGSLIYVASGRQSLNWLIDVKNSKNRALAAPTFGPSGLYLSGVHYDAKVEIPFKNKDFIFNKILNDMKIKICGLTCSENFKAIRDYDIDFIGLNFYKKSSRYITIEEALKIKK